MNVVEETLDYEIRVATLEEVQLAASWAAAEGWNPGHCDARLFYETDPTGFYVGLLAGKPIASISIVKYGTSFAFLGLYIVRAEHRGKGYGLRLWQAAMESVGSRAVGLDGVVAQQANYVKSGFAYRYANSRYEGQSVKVDSNVSDLVCLHSEVPFEQVRVYDTDVFGTERSTFLQGWVNQPDSFAFVKLGESKEVTGYGLIRPCVKGFKIGPLFADTPVIAEELFKALSDSVPEGSFLYLDTPSVNLAAVELAQRHGMSICFETARMYAGVAPNCLVQRIFGVTTFELG